MLITDLGHKQQLPSAACLHGSYLASRGQAGKALAIRASASTSGNKVTCRRARLGGCQELSGKAEIRIATANGGGHPDMLGSVDWKAT
jgi:hypothetical protein